MINLKMIYRIMGFLLYIETAFLLLCAGVALIYRGDDLNDFLLAAALAFAAAILLSFSGKGAKKQIGRRDGYIVVSFAWLIFSIFGMLPFYISGHIPGITNAFFETMSGFTTTGASILEDIESLPHGLLFWRSLTQWIGGLGIVFFTIAILPFFGVGGIQLFAAEATGPTHDKVHPRIGVTAKWIWITYLILTLSETMLLMLGGMNVFDSVCHSLTTTATGGYSTKQGSIASYNSAYIEYVITLFMFLSGINFTLLFWLFIKGKIQKLANNTELRWYVATLVLFTAITTAGLLLTESMGKEESFRKAIFQVVSLQTTTGFASADYMAWVPFLWSLMAVIMFFGGCAGSTAGAMKAIRMVILGKVAKNEFKRLIHPNAVLPVRVDKQVIPGSTISTVLAFTCIYIGIVVISWLTIMASGVGCAEAFGIVASSIGNVGPGLGNYGPAHTWNALPDTAKWILSFLMLVGRLEIFTVLLLLTPGFWKKN